MIRFFLFTILLIGPFPTVRADEPTPDRLIPEPLDRDAAQLNKTLGSTQSEALETDADWRILDAAGMAAELRKSLDSIGISADQIDTATENFLIAVEQEDTEPLTAWVDAAGTAWESVAKLVEQTNANSIAVAKRLDPSGPDYASVESMPPEMRAAVRTWIGRELVRSRFYDEALPIFAEVDPSVSPDASSLLFYRGACYHSLLKSKEALSDLRRLLQHEDKIPSRYSQTAKMMIADIKPLKKDSLDEISRLMTDVTRRLDLGRADEDTKEREQEIIDKLTKLIEKIEQQQQQQQQQQQSGGGGGGQGGGNAKPMDDSRIAGASGQGDADRKKVKEQDGWGNLPPAERQESLQQISRDLPTHYREAIEAYFRKHATQQR